MKTINQLGWDWRENGAIINVVVDGHAMQWFVPLSHVQLHFGESLASVGCPLQQSVGAQSVGGFFGMLKRVAKRATRKVKRAMPKAIRRAAEKVERIAKRSARTFRNVAKQSARGLGTAVNAGLSAAKYIPGPVGMAAGAIDTANRQLGRVMRGKGINLQQLATGFAAAGGGALGLPPALTQGAISAGTRIASGQRIDRALTSGALTAARSYIPGGEAGRQMFDAGRDLASGKRFDRTLRKSLMRAARSKGLRGVLPDSASLQAASSAWGTARAAARSAQNMRRGLRSAEDMARMAAGANTARGIRALAKRARRGDPRARMFVSAFRRMGRAF